MESAIGQLQKARARLTVDFKFREVAAVWLGKVAKRRADTTHGSYEQTLKSVYGWARSRSVGRIRPTAAMSKR
ncbi:hypothetical protein [Saccharopolyspora spinosa]|uniref:hypothetical protein n=1 Tax=Saccharopolyspora spinosa TaxID=60894 RepID=UPI0002379E25|nr:hypothetical protein [Saccharopolyspora spinosa]